MVAERDGNDVELIAEAASRLAAAFAFLLESQSALHVGFSPELGAAALASLVILPVYLHLR